MEERNNEYAQIFEIPLEDGAVTKRGTAASEIKRTAGRIKNGFKKINLKSFWTYGQFALLLVLILGVFIYNVIISEGYLNDVIKSAFSTSQTSTDPGNNQLSYMNMQLVVPASMAYTNQNGMIKTEGNGSIFSPYNGTVETVAKTADGLVNITISHANNLKTVIEGASMSFVGEGEEVSKYIPVAYCKDTTCLIGFFNNSVMISNYTISNNRIVWVV